MEKNTKFNFLKYQKSIVASAQKFRDWIRRGKPSDLHLDSDDSWNALAYLHNFYEESGKHPISLNEVVKLLHNNQNFAKVYPVFDHIVKYSGKYKSFSDILHMGSNSEIIRFEPMGEDGQKWSPPSYLINDLKTIDNYFQENVISDGEQKDEEDDEFAYDGSLSVEQFIFVLEEKFKKHIYENAVKTGNDLIASIPEFHDRGYSLIDIHRKYQLYSEEIEVPAARKLFERFGKRSILKGKQEKMEKVYSELRSHALIISNRYIKKGEKERAAVSEYVRESRDPFKIAHFRPTEKSHESSIAYIETLAIFFNMARHKLSR